MTIAVRSSYTASVIQMLTSGPPVYPQADWQDPAVKFDLVLPIGFCLQRAEWDLTNAFEDVRNFMAISQRSGKAQTYALGAYRSWHSISPASEDWIKNASVRMFRIARFEFFWLMPLQLP